MSAYTIIKNRKQYQEYSSKLMRLAANKTSGKIKDEMELLELLIDNWEKKSLKNDDMDPIELLKFLMKNNNVERNELIDYLKINKGTLSKILNYKKGLSKDVIRKLAEKFKVSQEAFNRPYRIHSDASAVRRKVVKKKKILEAA